MPKPAAATVSSATLPQRWNCSTLHTNAQLSHSKIITVSPEIRREKAEIRHPAPLHAHSRDSSTDSRNAGSLRVIGFTSHVIMPSGIRSRPAFLLRGKGGTQQRVNGSGQPLPGVHIGRL